MERYGVTNVFASDSIKQKIRETNNIRYGVDNPMQNTDVRLKAQQTCIDRHGVRIGFLNHAPIRRSKGEIELAEALSKFYPDLKTTDHKEIWPMELDIYIPTY